MDWLGNHLWETWVALAMVLVVAELFSLDLVLLMLATGAVVAAGLAVVDAPLVLQVLAATGVSVGMLAVVRPSVVKRLHGGPDLQLGPAKMIGATARVTKAISQHDPGTVTINGEIWSARPLDERDTMGVGELVDIYEVRGATVHVVPRPDMSALD